MYKRQFFVRRKLSSIRDGLYSFEVEEPIVAEEESLSLFTKYGIGVFDSINELGKWFLLYLLVDLRTCVL